MSDYTITLRVPGYLQQWMYKNFGSPVELLRDGPESRLLNELLRKQPELQDEPENLDDLIEIEPDTLEIEIDDVETGETMVEVEIKIPYFKTKDPRVYNHLMPRGRLAICESFKTLFIRDLLTSIRNLKNINVKQVTLIYTYMEDHGIGDEHYDTVKQIYYRNCKRYLKKFNIKVS